MKNCQDIMMKSQICKFYVDQNVFITGGTGFMGKLLIEKLLRSTKVANIYVLIRQTTKKDIGGRLDEMFENELFGNLKALHPEYKNRVKAIAGDVNVAGLGLSLLDRQKLISNVNIVFHLGATVRFFEDVIYSYNVNVEGTRSVLMLSKHMKNLKSVIYVSSMLVSTNHSFLEEMIYDSPELKVIEDKITTISASEVPILTKSILQTWPTIYSATKTMAELLIKSNANDLPIGVFRPSIVTSTYKKPLEGWTDGLSGATFVTAGVGMGLIHVAPFDTEVLADFVPGDFATAALIASAWNVNKYFLEECDSLPVYNYTSTMDCPLTWQECWELTRMHCLNYYPLSWFKMLPKLIFTNDLKVFWLLNIVLHYFPTVLIDLWRIFSFKKPKMVSRQLKVDRLLQIITFYNGLKPTYKTDNVRKMWQEMNEEDKKLFPFDLTTLQWLPYFRIFVKGLRRYVFKDTVKENK